MQITMLNGTEQGVVSAAEALPRQPKIIFNAHDIFKIYYFLALVFVYSSLTKQFHTKKNR